MPDETEKLRLSASSIVLRSIYSLLCFGAGFILCQQVGVYFDWMRLPGIAGPHLRYNSITPIDEYVDLPQGRVRGRRASDTPGDGVRAFLNIPFGTAGRWEVPRPAAPWSPRVLDATRRGTSCLRGKAPNASDMGEDCLHVNVFLPPAGQWSWQDLEGPGRPVLVWLHGGSFLYESADDTHAKNLRELVLTNHVIVVSVEYRLGILGFLASQNLLPEGRGGPMGNFGILDQQLGLKWVKENIGYFSGDPQRVTVAGWSAGAASVSAHLSMPSSEGLFQRAIMLSGGFVTWAGQTAVDAEVSYMGVLKASGCDKSHECLREGPPCACLKKLNHKQILAVDAKFAAAPTVDGVVLPHHPTDALRLQKVHKGVPVIIGSAIEDSFADIGLSGGEDEFKASLALFMKNKSMIDKAYEMYVNAPSEQNILEGQNLPMHSGWSRHYWLARRARADATMTCPARRAARAWRSAGGASAHWYLWGVGRDTEAWQMPVKPGNVVESHGIKIGSCWPCPGAGHGADQDFLFNAMGHRIPTRARQLSTIYPALMADFMKHGDPNVWNSFHLNTEWGKAWPPVEEGGMWFQINQTRVNRLLRTEVCDFWDAAQP